MRRFLLCAIRYSLRTASNRFLCTENVGKQVSSLPSKHFVDTALTNRYTYRSHTCGELRLDDVGKRVMLCGWLHYNRGKFIIIRDSYGKTQVLVPNKFTKDVKRLSYESVVKIEGTVVARPEGQAKSTMATGLVEVAMDEWELLNSAIPTLPFEFRYVDTPTDEVRLRFRYLDLRREDAQRNLRFRSDLVQRMRRFLHEKCAFVEIETPTLFRRTPGGAAEFVVPSSDLPGKFYCLPQSPQQFKQLLMIGGIDRYFQIARCYRDEGGRSDRQPEFTQVDLELSFATQKDVMELIENVIIESWPEEMFEMRPTAPFPSMSYADAMNRFGSDKPDVRFGMEITDMSQFGIGNYCCISAPYKIDDREVIERWRQTLFHQHSYAVPFQIVQLDRNASGELKWTSIDGKPSLPETLNLESRVRLERLLQVQHIDVGTVIFAGSGDDDVRVVPDFDAQRTLGFLRLRLADYLESKDVEVRSNEFSFLWIIDFPLFVPKDGPSQWESAHHPFTAPIPQHVDLLKTNPGECVGQHYDLVLNGVELGGGSIRIHDGQLQRYVLEEILREDVTELKHLLDALECGAPPHGGFAIGLDRYLAILLGTQSIKDVIAFPKTQLGRDPMCDAPADLSLDQLKRYHINVTDCDDPASERGT